MSRFDARTMRSHAAMMLAVALLAGCGTDDAGDSRADSAALAEANGVRVDSGAVPMRVGDRRVAVRDTVSWERREPRFPDGDAPPLDEIDREIRAALAQAEREHRDAMAAADGEWREAMAEAERELREARRERREADERDRDEHRRDRDDRPRRRQRHEYDDVVP